MSGFTANVAAESHHFAPRQRAVQHGAYQRRRSSWAANWINQVGSFQVDSTGGIATGPAGLNVATVYGLNAADVSVSATVNFTAGQVGGLVARYSGPATRTCTGAALQSTGASGYTAYIFRNVNGVWTALAAQAYSGSGSGNADLPGGRLRRCNCFPLNNTLLASAVDTRADVRLRGHARHRRAWR